ncbi:BQ2448_7146 [Microbotryum intermedium]|uniref:BQ2448_7146 protein n=1 Tax=Microbotryum intermedium TaxID=269621 RepID=A0A238FM42_9BASI|nr:BQ2448_7146 [Microbotryum intermedium]
MKDAVGEGHPHCWTSLMTAVGRRWLDPGFADRVAQDFYGCHQSLSWAYNHAGKWRTRYHTFMHDNLSFGLLALQLATAFYQSLNNASKREVRTDMLHKHHDNLLVMTGRFRWTVPSLDEITKWVAIANEILALTPALTLLTRTTTFGVISKAPRTTPPSTNDDKHLQIRRARWVDHATKWQQLHLWKD